MTPKQTKKIGYVIIAVALLAAVVVFISLVKKNKIKTDQTKSGTAGQTQTKEESAKTNEEILKSITVPEPTNVDTKSNQEAPVNQDVLKMLTAPTTNKTVQKIQPSASPTVDDSILKSLTAPSK